MVQQKSEEVLHFSTWQKCCSAATTRAINHVPAGWLSTVRRPRIPEIPSMECRTGPVNLSAWHPRDTGATPDPMHTHVLLGCRFPTSLVIANRYGLRCLKQAILEGVGVGKAGKAWLSPKSAPTSSHHSIAPLFLSFLIRRHAAGRDAAVDHARRGVHDEWAGLHVARVHQLRHQRQGLATLCRRDCGRGHHA